MYYYINMNILYTVYTLSFYTVSIDNIKYNYRLYSFDWIDYIRLRLIDPSCISVPYECMLQTLLIECFVNSLAYYITASIDPIDSYHIEVYIISSIYK